MFSLHFHYSCRNCRSRVEVFLCIYIVNFTLSHIKKCSSHIRRINSKWKIESSSEFYRREILFVLERESNTEGEKTKIRWRKLCVTKLLSILIFSLIINYFHIVYHLTLQYRLLYKNIFIINTLFVVIVIVCGERKNFFSLS